MHSLSAAFLAPLAVIASFSSPSSHALSLSPTVDHVSHLTAVTVV
jgi:hypothetical protein